MNGGGGGGALLLRSGTNAFNFWIRTILQSIIFGYYNINTNGVDKDVAFIEQRSGKTYQWRHI